MLPNRLSIHYSITSFAMAVAKRMLQLQTIPCIIMLAWSVLNHQKEIVPCGPGPVEGYGMADCCLDATEESVSKG